MNKKKIMFAKYAQNKLKIRINVGFIYTINPKDKENILFEI